MPGPNRAADRYTPCYTTLVHEVQIAFGAGVLLIWLYLFFAREYFWRVEPIPPIPARPVDQRIVAIVPARDEQAVIARSLTSLLQIPYIHVVLVDDNSTDATCRLAIETAARIGATARLTVVRGALLPPGWSGKLWAVQQGLHSARVLGPDFFLLTDADIVHSQADLNRLFSIAENGSYDLVSLMVRLRCDTFPEKLLIPAFVYFFFKLYPPAFIRSPRHTTSGAAGGCMLVRPEALEHAGGVQAIRNEIIDDCALARLVKRSGGKVWLGLAEQTHSIRSYGSFVDIGRMISRTAFNQLRHSWLLLAGTILGLLLTYIVPVAMLFSGDITSALAFVALALMLASYAPLIRYYGRSPLWAATLPLAALFYMGATLHSALKFALGRGGEWKGRAQDLAHSR